jgi:hypothetical protein
MVTDDINNDIIQSMKRIEKILEAMRNFSKRSGETNDSRGIRFSDLCAVCDHYFGAPRQRGTSHRSLPKRWPMPWPGDPRVNIQSSKGVAKAYQVKQVLLALDKLKDDRLEEEKKRKAGKDAKRNA